ncbi:MAG TPA: restriction endonuclease subunit S [Prolixibacteraceae bacterium]|nr:restriction endonuclease subunit S [Prolixibacteraceae bacterium]
MSWEKDKLEKHAKVISGYAFKSNDFNNSGGTPVIKIKNIQKEHVEINDEYYVDNSFLGIDSRFHCIKDDILISLTGSHITLPNSVVGRVAKYQYEFISLLNQRAGKVLITNPSKLDNNFLYYFLCLQDTRITLAQFGRGGANQCNISPSNVESIDVILPPLPTQKKIASILSAYDDLIENNLKRIKLLEEAAQNIYKEWFVNFRFPGWENTKFDKETGLPVGWNYKTLGESCQLVMGQSPESEFYNEKGDGLPFHQGVTGYGQRFVKHSTYCIKQTRIANEGDILCSVRAPVGRLNISPDKIIIGRGLSAIRNKNGFQSYQFYQLKNHFFQEDMIGGGAIFNSVTKKDLESQQLIQPSKSIVTNFEQIIKPIDLQISNLDKQNQKLKEARDILLPRLMNQTIEV